MSEFAEVASTSAGGLQTELASVKKAAAPIIIELSGLAELQREITFEPHLIDQNRYGPNPKEWKNDAS